MPGLLDPITIKGLPLKNRVVMPPMATHWAEDAGAAAAGLPADRTGGM